MGGDVQTFATDREVREWLYKTKKNEYMLFYEFDNFKDVEILYNSDDVLTRNVTLMTHKINSFFTLKDSV